MLRWMTGLFQRIFGRPQQCLLTRALIQTDGDSLPLVIARFHKRGKSCGKSVKTDCLWMDFGGAIFQNELRVEFEANGVRFGTYVRQLPTLLMELQYAKEPKGISEHFVLGGFLWRTVISKLTRDAAEEKVAALVKKYSREIGNTERAMERAFSGRKHLTRKARCICCGSEKPYVKCCGGSMAN